MEERPSAISPPDATSRWCSHPADGQQSHSVSKSESAWPAVIRSETRGRGRKRSARLELCEAYGWAPGVMGASSTAAQAFREAGLNAFQLGDEAILYPEAFHLSGSDMRAVRQAVTRARRKPDCRSGCAGIENSRPTKWPR